MWRILSTCAIEVRVVARCLVELRLIFIAVDQDDGDAAKKDVATG